MRYFSLKQSGGLANIVIPRATLASQFYFLKFIQSFISKTIIQPHMKYLQNAFLENNILWYTVLSYLQCKIMQKY